MDSLVGSTIDGKFQVKARLGVGGLGAVYQADQIDLGRVVALKVLHGSVVDDSELTRRFLQEARILAELSHPNIVKVYSFGTTDDDLPYMAMELLEGRTLDFFIRNRLLSWQEYVDVAIQICDAVEYAHRNGIVHRDIKPANVMVRNGSGKESVKVLDFGLSKIVHNRDTVNRLTQTGTLIGSVNYMSPELCAGGKADELSDVYSFACLLYECLAGEPPLVSDNPLSTLNLQINQMPVALSKRKTIVEGFPVELEQIIFKALQKKPEKRFTSMKELGNALRCISEGRLSDLNLSAADMNGGMASRPSTILICAAVLVVSALGFYFTQVNYPLRQSKSSVAELPIDDRTRHQLKARALLKEADAMIKNKRYKSALALLKRAAMEVALRYPVSYSKAAALQDLEICRELARELIITGPTDGFEHDMDELKVSNISYLSKEDYATLLTRLTLIQVYLGIAGPAQATLVDAAEHNFQLGRSEETRELLEQIAKPQERFQLGADALICYNTSLEIAKCYVLGSSDLAAAKKRAREIEKDLGKNAADMNVRGKFGACNSLAFLYQNLGSEEDFQRIGIELVPLGKKFEVAYPGNLSALALPIAASLRKTHKEAERARFCKDIIDFYSKLLPQAKDEYSATCFKSAIKSIDTLLNEPIEKTTN